MQFHNELVSEEDAKKFRFEETGFLYRKPRKSRDWTINEERNVFLRYYGKDREEEGGQEYFFFHWKGSDFVLRINRSFASDLECRRRSIILRRMQPVKTGEEKYGRFYSDEGIVLGEKHSFDKEEILSDLKAAFEAYGVSGIYSEGYPASVTFNF